MFRSVQQRDQSGYRKAVEFVKRSDSGCGNALNGFQGLRKSASTRFLSVDWDSPHFDSSGVKVQRIIPFGRQRIPSDVVDLETRLGWSIVPPKDGDYNGILLKAGSFHGESLVIEDFDLGSPHAWRKMF